MNFRRTRNKSNAVSILGEEVYRIQEWRYLGIHMDSKPDWIYNMEAVYKKGHNRL